MKKRLLACLILSGLALGTDTLHAQTYAYTARQQPPTRSPKQIPLRDALFALHTQYQVDFLFEERVVEGLTVFANGLRATDGLPQKLTALLNPFPLTYKKLAEGKYLILEKPLSREKAEATTQSIAAGEMSVARTGQPLVIGSVLSRLPEAVKNQDRVVKGRVSTAETGETLPGVNIAVKGTTRGTVTDAAGDYSLSILPTDAVLVFSFLGYEKQEVPLTAQSVLNVQLTTDTRSLNEVVVVGYGTQQKRDLTGSVGSLPAKKIENMPVTGLDQALTGQIAGVQVQQTTGAPGGNINVRVRGNGSIGAGNGPLYVIDGFPGVGSLNSINPNDIQSIEVLKDASAAAIYGSRGANGVVIITTKRGKAGQTRFNVNAYTGWQQVTKKMDVMNATEYAEHSIQASNNGYADIGGNIDLTKVKNSSRPPIHQIVPAFIQNDSTNGVNPALGVGTDWQDEIFQVAPIRNVELTASGGTDKIRYAITGGYFDQRGIIIESGFKRFSTRINIDADLSRKLKLGINLAPSYTRTDEVNSDDTWSRQGIVLSAIAASPHIPVGPNPDGTYPDQFTTLFGLNGVPNPVAIARLWDQKRQGFAATGNLFLDLEVLPGLNLRSTVGTFFTTSIYNSFKPSILAGTAGPPPSIATGESSSSFNLNWVNTNTATYTRAFGGKHNVVVVVGNETQKSTSESNSVSGTKFPTDAAPYLSAAGIVNEGSSGISEWSLLSYLGRVTYDFNRKYLLTVNIRRDGSSRFGTNNKYGTFPSASVGWQIAEESFMKSVPVVSGLKVRASYGLGGNNNIGNYAYRATLGQQNYVLGAGLGELVTGLAPGNLINPDLKWERSQQLDIGLDLGLFRDRVLVTVEYYDKETRDLLLNVNVPRITGFSSQLTNIGKVRNWGWEFSANSRNLVGSFGWSTDFNIFSNRNRVLALGPDGSAIRSGTSQIPDSHIVQVGQPLGNFYGYFVDGIFNTQAEIDAHPKWVTGNAARPGDNKFRDSNGDGLINQLDRVVIGNAFPKVNFGLTNTFTYKGFDLSVLLQGSQGGQVINGVKRFLITGSVGTNQIGDRVNSWQSAEEPGDGVSFRPWRGVGTSNNNANMNSRWMEDGSYLRVRNVGLGYSVPTALLKRVSLQTLRVYGMVQNAFTFTRYTGYNPEVSFSAGSVLNPGVDYGTYPLARTITLGLNVGF